MLLATAEDAGRAVDMFSGYMWQTRVLEVRLDRMVGEGGAVGYEQQLGQQQLGGQQQYGGMGQMVQQMLSPSMGMPQLGLHAYAKHNLGLGSLSGPGSPSVAGALLLLRCRLQRQDQRRHRDRGRRCLRLFRRR